MGLRKWVLNRDEQGGFVGLRIPIDGNLELCLWVSVEDKEKWQLRFMRA